MPEAAAVPSDSPTPPDIGGDIDSIVGDPPAADPVITPAVTPPPVEAGNWRDPITDPDQRKFADQFTTLGDMAKTGMHFKKLNSASIRLPGEDATEEDTAKFHRALGVPETPEGYEIKMPEHDLEQADVDSVIGELRQSMHVAGATPAVMQAVADVAIKMIQESNTESDKIDNESFEANIKAGTEALKKEWGNDYQVNTEYAKRGFAQFGGDEFVELLDNVKHEGVELSNHPSMLKVFANIGRKMGEGGLQTVVSQGERETTEQKLDELTGQAMDARAAGDNIGADRIFKEISTLSSAFYGQSN